MDTPRKMESSCGMNMGYLSFAQQSSTEGDQKDSDEKDTFNDVCG